MSTFGETTQAQNQAPSFGTPSSPRTSSRDESIIHRYKDSYTVANTANTFGKLAKLAGFVVAGVIAFIGLLLTFITVGSFRDSGVAFVVLLISLTVAAVFGSIFYVLGILLSAIGQNLMASLDSAVNGSPFMTNEQKAIAMDMPK